jgi:spermidine/putrescine transport system permease protein
VRRSRFPLAVTILVLLFFYLPIVVLVVNSFNASRFGTTWQGWTLAWYARLAGERPVWDALVLTLEIALVSTAGSVVLGTTAALALHRFSGRVQRFHSALVSVPLVMPEILMGISLLLFFAAVGLRLGVLTIVLAHVTFSLSYVAMVVLARLEGFDDSLLEAARDLGAGPWTTARLVLLPLLAPGIAAGALLAFTLSVDDFVITFFVAGPGTTTLPIRIYSMIKHGSPPLINALSTVLLAVTGAAVWLSQRLAARRA